MAKSTPDPFRLAMPIDRDISMIFVIRTPAEQRSFVPPMFNALSFRYDHLV